MDPERLRQYLLTIAKDVRNNSEVRPGDGRARDMGPTHGMIMIEARTQSGRCEACHVICRDQPKFYHRWTAEGWMSTCQACNRHLDTPTGEWVNLQQLRHRIRLRAVQRANQSRQ